MRIDCDHGYFEVRESEPGEVGRFTSLFGIEFIKTGSFFQPKGQEILSDHSFALQPYGGLQAIKNFEGKKGDVFRSNRFVWALGLKRLTPIDSVFLQIGSDFVQTSYYFSGRGLVQPGSRLGQQQITSYTLHVDLNRDLFRYSEVGFE